MKAADLITMLHRRHPPPEWALLEELHDATGAQVKRRFDALAFACWPSSGYVRYGFEIKVSRADFARELADHEKRAALESQCHQVYFVVSAGVCEAREVPEPWGLLVVAGDRLRCMVKPQHRKVGPVCEPLAVCAIRRLVKSAADYESRHYILDSAQLTQGDLNALVDRKMASAYEALEHQRSKLKGLQEQLAAERQAFESAASRWWSVWHEIRQAAGERHHRWGAVPIEPPSPSELAEAIARIRFSGRTGLADRLSAARSSIDAALLALAEPDPEAP